MKDLNDSAGWPSNYPGFTDPKPPAEPPASLPVPEDGGGVRHTDLFMAMALVLLILIVGVPLLVASILFSQ